MNWFKKCGPNNFGETKIELDVRKMGSNPEQDTDSACEQWKLYEVVTIPITEITKFLFPNGMGILQALQG